MEAFAERFKYLICTSGVMDKDYVPCLGGAPRIRDDVEVETSELGEPLGATRLAGRSETKDWKKAARDQSILWWRKAKERPDILLAGLVLVIATDWVVGWKMLLALIAILATVGGGVVILALQETPRKHEVSRVLLVILVVLMIQVPNPHVKRDSPSLPADPHAGTLESLQYLLDTSASLDSTVDSALLLLQSRPGNDTLPALRLAIHRLTDNMTDHLATATSSLLEMVDRKELAVLGEMYDIPIGPNANPNSRARAGTYLSEADSSQSIESIKRLSWNSTKPLIPLSLPMETSASSPARLKGDRGHTVHMSLGGMPLEDRFTSLPRRKPRASKRSSWAHEWVDQDAEHLLVDKSLSDQDSETHDRHQSSSDESKDTDLPRTPNPRRGLLTPRRSSPLSRRDSDAIPTNMPQRHIFPIVPPTPAKEPLLPSPFPKSPIRQDAKRRSLQSMPYFHSDRSDIASPGRASISGSSDMARGGSLQVSDLQMLRDQSTNGTPLQHRVAGYAGGALLSPTKPMLVPDRPRVIRVPSLSPLTLPGLKAACLSVHMKRRKMASCLLGLCFEMDEAYWREVRRVLDILVDSIAGEVEALKSTHQVAVSESLSILGNSRAASARPPWEHPTAQANINHHPDFAPRTSDEAILAQQIDSMQESLHRTWTDLQAMRESLGNSQLGNLAAPWTGIRGDLGDLIRQWDRGRESITRLEVSQRPQDDVDAVDPVIDADEASQPLPLFMKSWEDDNGLSSIATDSVRSTSDDTHDMLSSPHQDMQDHDRFAEVLPPPGQDMVFESQSLPAGIEQSKLSREERIKLMKEARESKASGTQEGSRGAIELGGDVVGELKSMIGLIRKRKGIEEVEPAPRALQPETPFDAQPVRARTELPAGFADDLTRAFVFPTARGVVGSQEDH
jgi:hypothetical protein